MKVHIKLNGNILQYKKMKTTLYKSLDNPDYGFSINESAELKYKKDGTEERTGNKIYSVWFDEYEGGEAYADDWEFEEEFKTFKEAKAYIEATYGKVKKITT